MGFGEGLLGVLTSSSGVIFQGEGIFRKGEVVE